jgi:hypothetical protein
MNSLFNTFNNGKVSTQFWVSLSGTIEQYLDSTMSAWATGSDMGNMQYCSVETEGCTTSPYAQPMTDEMVSALARLYSEGNRRHGWKFALANSAGTEGFAYHRLFSSTACPCDIRVNRRQDILTLAQGIIPPPTPSTKKGKEMIASTNGDGYWTTTHDGAVYAFGDAQFRGSAFDIDPITPGAQRVEINGTIVGIAGHDNDGYWLLASDGGVFAFGSANYYGRPDRT